MKKIIRLSQTNVEDKVVDFSGLSCYLRDRGDDVLLS
jgi:hypothetical protein